MSWVDSGICATGYKTCTCTLNASNCSWNCCQCEVYPVIYTRTCFAHNINFGAPPASVYCSTVYYCIGASCLLLCRNNITAQSCSQVCSTSPLACFRCVCLGLGGAVCCRSNFSGACSSASGAYRCCISFPYNCVAASGGSSAGNYAWACQSVVICNICQVLCHCVSCGAAACCDAKCVHSFVSIYACQCILDPAGIVSYLAIAYT